MLLELAVKDIALIKKASVEFGSGLNVLTGETGTGKSVIIGSAMLALGGRLKGDMVRKGAEYGLVELVFHEDDPGRLALLKEMDIEPDEEGNIIITRRISPARSVSRINDETATLSRLKAAASLLIDIYGQNEFHTLMDIKKHLEILDSFLAEEITHEKEETAAAWALYKAAEKKAGSFAMDERERIRQQELLSFEVSEIDSAALKPGEEEELSVKFKRADNARNILDDVSKAHSILAGLGTGRAMGYISHAMRHDGALSDIYGQLSCIQELAESALSEISAYAEGLEVDEGELKSLEKRLDLVRGLEAKYGGTVEDVLNFRQEAAEKLSGLETYVQDKEEAGRLLDKAAKELKEACLRLSKKRRDGAKRLCGAIQEELSELGFKDAFVDMAFREKEPSPGGADEAWFVARLNPGEEAKPIQEAASGGELSRIMLAIKTVLALADDMPTLIFDEIDTGISGRTAQKVAEKLSRIAAGRQVICVSHLPQIAAFADTHFVISKEENEGRNETLIGKLDYEGSVREMARLLGGEDITAAALANASEMKALAAARKEGNGI